MQSSGAYSNLIPLRVQSRYLPKKRNRIWEIDFLRGICVVLMILDHLSILIYSEFAPMWYGYDISSWDSFSRFCYDWNFGEVRPVIHELVLLIFFSISGISCTLSRSNRKRGSILLIIALVYSLCSLFAEEVLGISGVTVVFGVLHFLAVSMLIYALVAWLCKDNLKLIALNAIGIISVTLVIYYCYTPPATTPKIFAIVFPPYDYLGNKSLFYSQGAFSPGDLFTLIPYLAYYFFGVVIAPLLYGKRRSLLKALDGKWNKPVCFIGRHALIIYVLHVVLMALLLSLISGLFITPGEFGI